MMQFIGSIGFLFVGAAIALCVTEGRISTAIILSTLAFVGAAMGGALDEMGRARR